MIVTWKHKGLKDFFLTGSTKAIPAQLSNRIRRLLDALNQAITVDELKIPGFYCHELKGNRQGTWTMKVSGNWRITFRFINSDAVDVDMEDYH